MRLLLTGATGFVGRNLLLKAVREGLYQEIFVPVRSEEKLRAQFLGDGFEGIPSKITPIKGDASDWKFDQLTVDHVVHSAGALFASTREEYFNTNVEGTLSLLKRLAGNPRVVILSSLQAAGPCPPSAKFRLENDKEAPINWYGESKLEMEKKVLEQFGTMNVLLLRPPMILGPRDSASLPIFKMVKSPVRFLPGRDRKYFSFISVDDLVEAIAKVLEDQSDWKNWPLRQFFVSTDETISDSDILSSTSEILKKKGVTLKVPHRLLGVISGVVEAVPALRQRIPSLTRERYKDMIQERWTSSSENFRKKFPWKPKDTLQSTLKATADWYLRTGQLT